MKSEVRRVQIFTLHTSIFYPSPSVTLHESRIMQSCRFVPITKSKYSLMKLQLMDASYSGIVEVSVSAQTASGDVAAALDSGFRRNDGGVGLYLI